MEEYYYKGQKYLFSNGVWLTQNYLSVPTSMQGELNKLLYEQKDFSNKSVAELLEIIDKSRAEKNNIQLAEKLLKIALQKANDKERVHVLPRRTSNLRMVGRPLDAIALANDYITRYRDAVMSHALFTSMGAAYCDLGNYKMARSYANRAYATGGKGDPDLKELYQRLDREISPVKKTQNRY